MSKDPAWLRALAECYLKPDTWADVVLDADLETGSLTVEERHGAVLSQIWRLEKGEPEDCWRFIQVLCTLTLTKQQTGTLGAGLFEDLMGDHGPLLIDRVEKAVRTDPIVRSLVDAVWTNHTMDQSVIRALKSIKASPRPPETNVR